MKNLNEFYHGKSVEHIYTKIMPTKKVDLYRVSGFYLVVCFNSYEFHTDFYKAQYRTECI